MLSGRNGSFSTIFSPHSIKAISSLHSNLDRLSSQDHAAILGLVSQSSWCLVHEPLSMNSGVELLKNKYNTYSHKYLPAFPRKDMRHCVFVMSEEQLSCYVSSFLLFAAQFRIIKQKVLLKSPPSSVISGDYPAEQQNNMLTFISLPVKFHSCVGRGHFLVEQIHQCMVFLSEL